MVLQGLGKCSLRLDQFWQQMSEWETHDNGIVALFVPKTNHRIKLYLHSEDGPIPIQV